MNRNHRILPAHRRRPTHHRAPVLVAFLFIGLFAIFTLLVLASKLSPAKMTALALNDRSATTVNITGVTATNCNTTIPLGTSLQSFSCIPISMTRQEFFTNLSAGGANVEVMYKYTPSSNGQWQAYNASLPSSVVQTLTDFGNLDGIYFKTNAPEYFNYYGFLPSSSNILIRSGWNLIGYPTNRVKSLGLSIQSINDSYAYISTLEGTEETGQYLWDVPPPGGDTLLNTTPFHGYWIRNTVQDYWVVLQ